MYNFKAQLEAISKEASSIDRIQGNFLALQSRFVGVKAQELDNLFSKIGLKAIMGTAIYRVITYFKEMLTTVKDVDTAMVSLKRVTSQLCTLNIIF
jgi:hypothetical protein